MAQPITLSIRTIQVTADTSGISKKQPPITREETSRQKWVAFAGITHTDLLQRLELPLDT